MKIPKFNCLMWIWLDCLEQWPHQKLTIYISMLVRTWISNWTYQWLSGWCVHTIRFVLQKMATCIVIHFCTLHERTIPINWIIYCLVPWSWFCCCLSTDCGQWSHQLNKTQTFIEKKNHSKILVARYLTRLFLVFIAFINKYQLLSMIESIDLCENLINFNWIYDTNSNKLATLNSEKCDDEEETKLAHKSHKIISIFQHTQI